MSELFFDTNIIIDWLNDHAPAAEELGRHDRVLISRIVWAEVLAGEAAETRETIEEVLSAFEVVEVDAATAMLAADIRHRTRMKLMDALIYATSQLHDAVLVTRNTKDFPATMPGIRVPYQF